MSWADQSKGLKASSRVVPKSPLYSEIVKGEINRKFLSLRMVMHTNNCTPITLRSIQTTPPLLQKMANVVPLIDLSDFPAESERLREACEGIGCFRIVNHSVPAELIAEMKSMAGELLDLPTEVKQRNKDVIPGSGYMARSAANPFYEALGLYDVGNVHSVEEFCSQLGVSKHQRETIEWYAEAIHKVTVDIAKLARSYGLEEEEFEGWNCQFRINKYNFTQDTVGSPGVQIHTDSGFLTVLQDDENVGGLEVTDRSGSFVAVDPFPRTLAVNLGDIGNVSILMIHWECAASSHVQGSNITILNRHVHGATKGHGFGSSSSLCGCSAPTSLLGHHL